MVKILALCHGKNPDNPPGTKCYTQYININKATLLDKNTLIKPDILQDLKKPFTTKQKYDIITTVCCDTNAFYNDKTKTIEKQTFQNIKLSLKKEGLFIFPKYYWVNTKIIKEIELYFTLEKKFKEGIETFYIFKKTS